MAKALSRKVTIYINGREVENTLSSLRAEMKKLESQQAKLPIGSEEYIQASLKIREIKSVIREQEVAVRGLGDSWKETRTKLADYSNMIMGVQSVFQMVDLGVGKLKDLAKDAAALDDVYADVMKTTGLTHEQVEKLNEAFRKMDTRTSREQLNQLAYEAGKLGISSEEAIKQFVSASDKINIALGDVLGEGAMVTVGKLTNIYESVSSTLEGKNLEEKMLAIGSAVNSLGQASTANEGYMVEFMKRLGGIASQAGLSADQVLGYASALDQNGQAVEMSATAFMKLIQQMVKKPQEFVQAAGVSMEEFKRMMDTDMNGAIMRVLEGMEKGGGFQQLIGMFADMGLDGARAATVVSSLAKHLDQVREAQALANQEMKTGNSVINEFNTKNNTMQAQAEKAKKRFEEVRIELGNELYPILIHLQKTGTVFMKWFAALAQVVKNNRWILLSFTTALIALNYAKLKKIANDKLDTVQTRINNALTKTGTTLSKIHTAEQERARLAALKLQKARIALASSNKTVTYSIDGMRMSSDKMTAARNIDLAITRQQTVANKSLGVAMKAVPWGWVITAVSVLAPLVYKLFTHQSKVNEAEKEAARQYGEAEGKLRVLKERMMGAKEGSAEYLEALNELKSEYPDIIQLHLDEKGAIRDLEAAYKDLSAAARQSAYDRVYAEKTSEAYGDLAEKVQSQLQSVMRGGFQAAPGYKSGTYTEAVRAETQRIVGEVMREVSEGKKTAEAAYKYLNEKLKGIGVATTDDDSYEARSIGTASTKVLDALKEIENAYKKTEKTVRQYKDALKPDKTEEDPYGYAKMSLEELEKELASATSSMNDMKRQWELWKKESPDNPNTKTLGENYLHEKKRVEQLTAAIVKLKKAQGEGGNNGGGGNYGSGESEKERKARERAEAREAKRIADAWKKAEKDAKKMTDKFNLQAESGLQRVKDDVDAKTEEMIGRLRQTAEEAGQSSEDLERNLVEAAERYKETKVAEYFAKVEEEIGKMQKAAVKSDEGERLNKVNQAIENMRQQLRSIDNMIAQLNADLGSEEEGSEIYREIEEKIEILKRVKKEAVSAAFSSIDFKVNNPLENQSSFSLKDNQTRIIDEVKKKVKDYSDALSDAEAAYRKMAETAKNEGDDDKAKEYEAQADALKKQADGIEEISEKAEKLAKQNALKETLDAWCDGIEKFTDQALLIFGNINQLLDNIADSELQKMERQKESAIENLDEQLKQGLISQEEYEESKKTLEDEYKDKENEVKLEQWRRQKALDLTQAIIGGALAAVRAYAEGGPYAGPVLAAMVAAATGIQIAAIENQPEPYAKGGYVQRRTVYQAGEAGPEWVASNTLLSDPATAPIIEALESYQRGNRRALADIPMAQLNMPVVTAAAMELGRRSAGAIGTEVVRGWKPGSQNVTVEMPGNEEMMQLWRELAEYLKDPKNRRAVISRQTMTDFENNENFLRSRARL